MKVLMVEPGYVPLVAELKNKWLLYVTMRGIVTAWSLTVAYLVAMGVYLAPSLSAG